MTTKVLSTQRWRGGLAGLVRAVRRDRTARVLTTGGREVAALLPMAQYRRLMSQFEDYLDERDPRLMRDVALARRQIKNGRSKPLAKLTV